MEGGETCYMNSAAGAAYGFTPDTCWSESYWKLLRYILSDHSYSVPEFKKYLGHDELPGYHLGEGDGL